MQPRDLDLNDLVTSLAKMLQRIIEENVQLELLLFPRPVPVNADAGMLDQLLLNLAVNARDAMSGGGKLSIETSLVMVDEALARRHANARPGPHARLVIRDTGCGIPPDVMPGGLGGRDLAAQLQSRKPELKVIFTSGYSESVAGRRLGFQDGKNFIQKPCPPHQLLETVRRCLDEK